MSWNTSTSIVKTRSIEKMKHEQALGKNGVIYYPKDIFNINKLVDMRYHGLTDLDKQFELIAVNGEKKKYFRFKKNGSIVKIFEPDRHRISQRLEKRSDKLTLILHRA